MLPLHLSPAMLMTFMVALAVVPLGIIWLDERRSLATARRLAGLRAEVALRERLTRQAMAEGGRCPAVVLPQG